MLTKPGDILQDSGFFYLTASPPPPLCSVKDTGIQTPMDGTLGQGSPTSRQWTGTSCQISGSIRLEIKCTINVMCFNHLETIPPPHPQLVDKLPSTKLVPGAKKVGDHRFRTPIHHLFRSSVFWIVTLSYHKPHLPIIALLCSEQNELRFSNTSSQKEIHICWRSLLRGCDCKLTLELDPGNQASYLMPLSLECTLHALLLKNHFQRHRLEGLRHCWDHLDSICDGTCCREEANADSMLETVSLTWCSLLLLL